MKKLVLIIILILTFSFNPKNTEAMIVPCIPGANEGIVCPPGSTLEEINNRNTNFKSNIQKEINITIIVTIVLLVLALCVIYIQKKNKQNRIDVIQKITIPHIIFIILFFCKLHIIFFIYCFCNNRFFVSI